MTTHTRTCVLCHGPTDGDDQSSEHIILAALGGWHTVSGFICRRCNNETGRTWDAALAASFEDWIRLLDITRQEKLPRAPVIYLSDGTPIRPLPGNRMELGHPIVPEGITDGKTVVARSFGELRAIIQTINERRNLGLDVEAILENAKSRARFIDEPIEIKSGEWGP